MTAGGSEQLGFDSRAVPLGRLALPFPLLPGTGIEYPDAELCQRFTEHGKPALLIMEVCVDECFFHCGKALLRSSTWEPSTWPAPVPVSFGEEIAAQMRPEDCGWVEEFDRFVQDRYRNDL